MTGPTPTQPSELDQAVRDLRLMRAALDSSSTFVHVLSGPTFIIEYANAAYFRLVGQRDLIGRPAFEAMPEAAAGGFPDRIAHVLQTGEPFFGGELPVTLARSPGDEPEVRFIDLTYVRLNETEAGPGRVVGHGTDVTEHVLARRGAERLTQETRDRLAEALTAAKMAAWEWNPATGKLNYSDSMPQLYRLGPQDARVTPSDWQAALHPEDRDAHADLILQAVKGEGSWHTEFRLRGHKEVWLEERAHVKTDEASGDRRIVGLVWDISERKQLELDLRRADERKSSFLATLSHELRNPLAPLRSGLDLLRRFEELPDKVKAVHGMMDRQVTHLVRLVDDLMDVSRISHDKVELRKERLLLGSVLSSAIETVWPRMAEKELHLESQIEGMHWVDADRDRLTQVFANLLTNSAKFTPRSGTIRVSAKADHNNALISVSDTGCGIAPDRLQEVFEMFSQGPNHHAAGGLGIGLALVRQLVSLHGGTVEARSNGVGQGSEFVVRLPLTLSAAVPPAPGIFEDPGSRPARARDVLVVDDNVDAAVSLAEAFRARGHSVRTSHDGAGALEACRQRVPEVVILDIGLPDLDGREVARRIATHWPAPEGPRLAALTGWGQPHDKQQAIAAGFDFHFTKPVRLGDLFSTLDL